MSSISTVVPLYPFFLSEQAVEIFLIYICGAAAPRATIEEGIKSGEGKDVIETLRRSTKSDPPIKIKPAARDGETIIREKGLHIDKYEYLLWAIRYAKNKDC